MTAPIAKFEDRMLIEMTVAGRTDCFSVLMKRHRAAVTRCIGAIVKNRSDVEDLVQETFLKAWLRLSTFRFEANFRTWITRVAVNEALASYRRQRRRPLFQALANFETFASSWESPDKTLARLEARRTVRSAIAGLPKKYREILTLFDLEQLSARETARELKSSIPLVKTRLFRARHMLLAVLNRDAAWLPATDKK
jgi:RNA polymerase sigma-70 factor, ECF subfamily